MKTPEAIKKFVDVFSQLPGIGPRQAIRLTFYFIHQGVAFETEAAKALAELRGIKICKQCFYIHENVNGLCDICGDTKRNEKLIAIVEKETDLLSIENTGKFAGRYLILGDLRKNGILESDQKLRIQSFKSWITERLNGKAEEIIIAINPTTYGDLNASLIGKELQEFTNKISRLGRGIPTGGEIEFADEDTLSNALERRH
mgnify:CR=1 FL=1